MSIFFENVDSLPSRRERSCWFHIRHLNWVVKYSTNKVKVRSELICTLSLLILTTFCKPSMRLLTTCRRPLSSWNMVLSSSHERSHISAPTSSVFWPMMFVVMEGLTSTTSVLSLTILASSGGAGKNETSGRERQTNEQHRRRWWKTYLRDTMIETQGLRFPVFSYADKRSQQCGDYDVYCVPKNRCSVSGVWLVKCICLKGWR